MADKKYSINLNLRLYDQRNADTWAYVTDGTDATILSFRDSGCAICALASYKKITIMGAKDKGVFSISSPLVKNWLGAEKKTVNNYLEYITDRIVNSGLSTIVHVSKSPGHYVTVTGFQGTLPLNSLGRPICTAATSSMVLINDSWEGRCKTLADLLSRYSSIDFVQVQEIIIWLLSKLSLLYKYCLACVGGYFSDCNHSALLLVQRNN